MEVFTDCGGSLTGYLLNVLRFKARDATKWAFSRWSCLPTEILISLKRHCFYGIPLFSRKHWIYVNFSDSQDLGGNTYDFGFIFVLFRANCENCDSCAEIVTRELVSCCFCIMSSSFQLCTLFYADFTKNAPPNLCSSQWFPPRKKPVPQDSRENLWNLGVFTPNDQKWVFLLKYWVLRHNHQLPPQAWNHQYSLRNIDGYGDHLHAKVDSVPKMINLLKNCGFP